MQNRYGMLIPIEKTQSNNGAIWLFKCDCGNTVEHRLTHINRRIKRTGFASCGCVKASSCLVLDGKKICTKCNVFKPTDRFAKNKMVTNGLSAWCKDCYQVWRKENSDRLKKQKGKYAKTAKSKEQRMVYAKENPEINRAAAARYRANNPEKRKESANAWSKRNPAKNSATASRRRSTKLQATPWWADLKEIEAIYAHAALLNSWPGEKIHVDHIVPLKSNLVCGLHVPANLRLEYASDNIRKSNKVWPDMW